MTETDLLSRPYSTGRAEEMPRPGNVNPNSRADSLLKFVLENMCGELLQCANY
jgi:hypothetical protein